MKEVVIRPMVILFISGSALAGGGGEEGRIGLYSDPDHLSCAVTGPGIYPVEMWIWGLPGNAGSLAAEFMITYPSNVIATTVTKNTALIAVDMGTYSDGYSVNFFVCQWTWFWPGHQLLYVTSSDQTTLEVVKHPDETSVCIQMAGCEQGYPPYCVCGCPRLWLNLDQDPCQDPCATEPSSWGAIKVLVKQATRH